MKKLLMAVIFFTITAVIVIGYSKPNVKPFIDSTLEMNDLVISEHGEIRSKLEYLSKIELRRISRREEILKMLHIFNKQSKELENKLSFFVVYSNSIYDLAGDKTDGGKAIAGISENLSKVSDLLGIGGNIINIGKATDTMANWITEIQKQKELEKAMTLADPVIEKISDAMSEEYSKDLASLVEPIAGMLGSSLDDKYPTGAVMFYIEANARKNLIYQKMRFQLDNVPQTTLTEAYTIMCSNKDEAKCIEKDNIKNINEINKLIADAKPIYYAYTKEMEEIEDWKKDRINALKKLAVLSKVWSEEHSKVLDILKNCNSLSKNCKNFNSISINNIIDIVK